MIKEFIILIKSSVQTNFYVLLSDGVYSFVTDNLLNLHFNMSRATLKEELRELKGIGYKKIFQFKIVINHNDFETFKKQTADERIENHFLRNACLEVLEKLKPEMLI